jgi:hypothetical protein
MNAVLQYDFGTAQDPGNNTFRCNAAPPELASTGPGADLKFEFHNPVQPIITIPFEGNIWDHAPTTVGTSGWLTGTPPGIDVWVASDDAGVPLGGKADLANATTVSTPPCPSDRATGP